jgi:hypothetical protein
VAVAGSDGLATAGTATTSIEPDRLFLLATHGQVTGAGGVQRRDSSWVLLIDELDAGRCRLIERSRTAITTNKDTIAGKPGSAGWVPQRSLSGTS